MEPVQPMRARYPALALLAGLLLAGCSPQAAPPTTVRVEVSHFVDDQPLQLGDTEYAIDPSQRVRFSRLRYYLSNFRFRTESAEWRAAPGYFLVDEADAASRRFTIDNLPAGDYTGVEFLIGIDDARNGGGAQTGALDPAKGMFWTWQSGYIFFALEGQSPQSGADGGAIIYHVGGRTAPSPARTVYLPLGDKPLKVSPEVTGTVHLHANVAEVFRTPHPLDLAKTHSVMDPKSGAVIADNYADLFRVDHIHHEPASR